MSKARNLANLFSGNTDAATDAEVAAAMSAHSSNTTNRHYKVGDTASRPESPSVGDLYFDTDLDGIIQYKSGGWQQVAPVPNAPTSVSATVVGLTATVSFTAPTNVPVTSYVVTSSPGNITNSGSSSPILITGLTDGIEYTFSVIAQGSNGNSQSSLASNSVIPENVVTVDYLVIGGGAGGGANSGGGGGAGGYRSGSLSLALSTSHTVTVGGGGSAGLVNYGSGGVGGNSVFATITSAGGGTGAGGNGQVGGDGGSGGGGGGRGTTAAGGLGNTPSTSPSQGNNGAAGTGTNSPYTGGGGGGGGAGAAGSAKNGGNGLASDITGTSVTRAGGGGGGGWNSGGGTGGSGGGGNGGADGIVGSSGASNTGGGGGAGGDYYSGRNGASGGSGIVIVSSPMQASSTTGSPSVSTSNGRTIYQFTASGSITF